MDDTSVRREEVSAKLTRLRQRMAANRLDGAHLTTIANTAWLTAGASTYVDESIDAAACSLLITTDDALVLTDPIEEPRLREEERLGELGFRFVIEPWHSRGAALQKFKAHGAVASDRASSGERDMSAELLALRSALMPEEQERLRAGARLATNAMWEAACSVAPGMSEHEAAALLAGASRARGGTPTVILVASDGRIAQYRHPLPTQKAIERHVMLVLCFRYRGLVSALTRTVYFGAAPSALKQLTEAVARVDAEVIAATQPGRTLGAMFEVLQESYRRQGDPHAIEEHHQGGTIGYLARETLARPGLDVPIETGQAFAWNPSMRGAKSEDTMILTANGPEIITMIEGWPTLTIETGSGRWERPAILAR